MDRAPDSVADSLRHLWCRVLFPAAPAALPGRPMLLHLAVLLLLPAALLYPRLGFALFEPDESRYAQIPREMLDRGDAVVPTLQGEPYLDKPPLFYWLVMLSYRAFGVGAWQARLVPALAVHATLFAVYLLGRRSAGDRPAFLAALLLALAPGFLAMSRLLILDGLLMLFCAVALLAALEAVRGERFSNGWWLASAVASGLGVLTKGPLILLLVAPPLALYASRLTAGRAARYLAVTLAISVPWFVALGVRRPEFVTYFFWEHNVQRFLAPGIHVRGVWFYGPVLFALLVPASFLLVPFVRFLLSKADAAARTPELGFHLAAAGWCVGFFTLSACKLPTYVMPAMPPLALALGVFLVHARWDRSRAVIGAAVASFAALLGLNLVALPWYADYRSPVSRPEAVLEYCGDPSASVVCYPRNCDSVAFYLGRSDLRVFRSKDIEELRTLVRVQPRTVILCTHRSSLAGLKQLLPPEVRITREVRLGLRDIPGVPAGLMKPLAALMGETALGLGDICVVEMPGLTAPPSSKAPPASAGPAPPPLAVPGRTP
ncbi:MAG: ArnT family glycosyltransferase [Gemmataceae bacterium]